MTLKSSSSTFLPLYLTTLNFSQASRQAHIAGEDAVVGYFPVKFNRGGKEHGRDIDFEDDEGNLQYMQSSGKTSRPSLMRVMHTVIRDALKPVMGPGMGLCL